MSDSDSISLCGGTGGAGGGAGSGDGPKVVILPQRDACAAATDLVKRNLDALIEQQKMVAKIRRAAFLAYVKEGFTEAQALELCQR